MSTKQRFAFAFMLIVIVGVAIAVAGCGTPQNVDTTISPNVEPVKSPEETHTTAEWLRLAQLDYDARKLDEALKKVLAVQPEENEQNQSKYREYIYDSDYEDDEVIERWNKNEFRLKDTFLVKLVDPLLAGKQSGLAVVAARNISLDTTRDRMLVTIVKAQCRGADIAWSDTQTRKINDVDEMLDKAVQTASYLDTDRAKNEAYGSIVYQMDKCERFLDAAEQAANIPDRQKRNEWLKKLMDRCIAINNRNSNSWNFARPGVVSVDARIASGEPADQAWKQNAWDRIQVRIDVSEAAIRAIIAHMDDPKQKTRALYKLSAIVGSRDAQNNIIFPKKCEKYLAETLDMFDIIENSDAAELRVLAFVAALYEQLEINEKAKSVQDLIVSRIPDLEPAEGFGIYLLLLNNAVRVSRDRDGGISTGEWIIYGSHIMPNGVSRSRFYEYPSYQYPYPGSMKRVTDDLQERIDQLVCLILETFDEIPALAADYSGDPPTKGLLALLDYQPSMELYREIHDRLIAGELSDHDKIQLAEHYLYRYMSPELSQEEQFDGFKNLFLPLLSDIDSKTEPDRQVRKKCDSYLSCYRTFLTIQTEVDEMIRSAPGEPDAVKRFENYLKIAYTTLPRDKDITPILAELMLMAQGDDETGIYLGRYLDRSIRLFELGYHRPSFMSEAEKLHLRQNIEQAIERKTHPYGKYMAQWNLANILLHRITPYRPLPEESVRLEQLTRLLELAQAIPTTPDTSLGTMGYPDGQLEPLDVRLKTRLLTAQLAERMEMSAFANQVVEEALVFGETMPEQEHSPRQISDQMEQLREIKAKLADVPQLGELPIASPITGVKEADLGVTF